MGQLVPVSCSEKGRDSPRSATKLAMSAGYSLGPPPVSVNGRMFVNQPTYVEKPKYMSAGRLFHSDRKYQSDQTHVAFTQVGHALVVAYTPIYKHADFIRYMCTTLGLTAQSMLSLQNAAIPPKDMPIMSFAEWERAGVTEDDILLLLDFIFADTPPFCAACKLQVSELCSDSAFSGTPLDRYDIGSDESYLRVAAPGYCFALEVYTRPSSVTSDWGAFVDGYYAAVKQASSELAEELSAENAADSNSMF